jgi:hypothetical protein
VTSRHLLVIGAQRSGTTYLHRVLDAHPAITMARPARPEPKFFLAPDSERCTAEDYRARLFAHATTETLLGEKSTSYIESDVAGKRAAAVVPEASILVMLRDPLARAISNWRFSADSGLEDRPLDEALADNLRGPRPWDRQRTSVSPYAYLERGRYVEAIRPWRDAFGELLHVQFLEDLLADPARLAQTLAHVGVDEAVGEVTREPVNESDVPAPTLDPALRDALRRYFAESDRELEAVTGRRPPWAAQAGERPVPTPNDREDTGR